MCRLIAICGITGVNKLFIFDQVLARCVADGDNSSGVGITDGKNIFKSGLSYTEIGLEWLEKLNPELIWMGHVRRASRGTEVHTPTSAHPFFFPKTGLIGAHNGFISDTQETERGAPNVDSYRALNLLSSILEDNDNDLSIGLINTWVDTFGSSSEWAFMLYHNNYLWILRGQRTIFSMSVYNGTIYCTSELVLQRVKHWLKFFWNEPTGAIITVPQFTAIQINQNSGLKNKEYKICVKNAPPVPRYYKLVDGKEEVVY